MNISLRKTIPLFCLFFVFLCLFLLPNAYADGLEDLVNAVNSGEQAFTVSEDTTIPDGMHLEAWDTEITVQQGKTLTILGGMNTSTLNINGTVTLEDWGFFYADRITLGSAGRLNITCNNFVKTSYDGSQDIIGDNRIHFGSNARNVLLMEISVENRTHFNSALNTLKAIGPERFVGDIRVVNTFTLGSGTIDMNTRPFVLEVVDGKTLTVPSGATLKASVISVYGSTLKVNGTLNANAEIRLEEGGMLKFANNNCFVNNPGAHILLRQPANPDTQITGLDMSRFTRYDRGSEILFVDNSALFAQFKAACQSGDASFDLSNQGVFEIEEDITIPAGMTVDARGTTFSVPAGRHLTLNGTIIMESWNYFGQDEAVLFGTTGRMRITTWSGLAANIWEYWKDHGWTNQVDFDDGAGVILLYGGFENADHLVDLLDHLRSVLGEHVKANVTVDRAPIDARGTTLTIPVNVTLFVRNVLTIDSLNIDQNENGHGSIRVPEGGELHVADWIDLYNNIYDELLHDFDSPSVNRITYDNDAGLALHRGVFSAGMDYDGLARALSDGANYVAGKTDHLWFFAHVPPDEYIEAWDTALTVPEGVELVVEDDANLNTRGLMINGRVRVRDDGFLYAGSITLGDDGRLYLTGNNDVKTYYDNSSSLIGSDRVYFNENSRLLLQKNVTSISEFTSAYRTFKNIGQEHFIGEICVHQNITLSSNVDLNTKPISLELGENTTMTVPAGKTLKANRVNMYDGSKLQVNGTLESNAEIRIGGATLAFAQGSSYVNHPGGYIRVIHTTDLARNVTGLGELDWRELGDGSFAYVDNAGLFQQLKAACTSQTPPETYNLTNSGEIVISENLTIPAGMTVDARGTTFTVPVGNTVTIKGKLILTRWNLNGQNTAIDIPNGGELHIAAWNGLAVNIWQYWEQQGWTTDRVIFDGDAGVYLGAEVRNDQQLANIFNSFAQAQPNEHVQYEIRVAYACTLSDSLTIPGHIRVILYNGLTVPADVVLTTYGTITARSDAVMTINGTLINNNFIEMEHRNTATGAMLRVNGKCGGAGSFGVKDHDDPDGYFSGVELWAYRRQTDNVGNRYFFNREPDLWLPASLRLIDEEAFAGCAFVFPVLMNETEAIGPRAFANCPNLLYIHIPAATTDIDPSAFDGSVGLTIFCYPGSAAEQFAQDNGINYWRAR